MKLLEDRIRNEGIALSDQILKVDGFINHQVDPFLMKEIGDEIGRHFDEKNITKVVTIESSGISPALMAAMYLNVPMIILKKQASKVLNEDVCQTNVTSFTKGTSYELTLSKKYVTKEDNVLIVDDFMANGEAAFGAVRLLEMVDAKIQGVAILIEKSFQPGRERMDKLGIEVFSLARIAKMEKGNITFGKADE